MGLHRDHELSKMGTVAVTPDGSGHVTRMMPALQKGQRVRSWPVALVHESDSGAKVSSAALIGYLMAKDFGLPSSNIRFRMLHAISASASCDSG